MSDFAPPPEDGPILRFLARLPLARGRPVTGYGFALAASLLGLVLRLWVDHLLPPGFPFVTFFPVVICTAFLFGLGPGVFAAVLCALISNWFFIAPLHAFSISGGAGMAMALYAFVVVVDIALVELMQRAFRRLETERERNRRLAEHREVLFRELQHRVGNNLQMIGSLLTLQKRKLKDPAALSALDEAARRLGLIGRIQRQLYDPDGGQLALRSFLDGIARDSLATAARDGVTCSVDGGDGLVLDSEAAIPLALVVAEAVANAIEHGFAGRDGGHVAISIAQAGPMLRIEVADDGAGLPPGFDASTSASLGLRLAQSLAASRGGSFALVPRAKGAVAVIEIREEGAASRED